MLIPITFNLAIPLFQISQRIVIPREEGEFDSAAGLTCSVDVLIRALTDYVLASPDLRGKFFRDPVSTFVGASGTGEQALYTNIGIRGALSAFAMFTQVVTAQGAGVEADVVLGAVIQLQNIVQSGNTLVITTPGVYEFGLIGFANVSGDVMAMTLFVNGVLNTQLSRLNFALNTTQNGKFVITVARADVIKFTVFSLAATNWTCKVYATMLERNVIP